MLARLSLIAIAVAGASACDSRSEVRNSPTVSTTPIRAPSRATYHAEVLFEFQSARLGGGERLLLDELVRVESKGAREPATSGRCDGMGPEIRQNAQLVACLQPDRRAEIEIRPRAER